MVVVVIVGVIMLVAAPSYTTLIERTQLKSYANELVASFYLARSEAIKRNSTMTLCVSTDGVGCTGGGDWEQGWIVFDDNHPDDIVVKHQQSLASGIILFHLSSASFTSMRFEPSGLVNDADAPAQMKLCKQLPSAGVEEKIVRITVTGTPNIQTTTDGCP
jgi:type IV fimbrial biogenesis protein FimT